MKFVQRTALVCSITASFSLAIACGSNDSSGLFATGGSGENSSGGSFANGGSSAHAGQANGGSNSNRGGSVGNTNGGHANGGGNTAGDTSSGGSSKAGTGAGGDSGGTTAMGGAAMGGSAGSDAAGTGGSAAGAGGSGAGAGGTSAGGAGGMSGGGAGGMSGGSGGGSGGSGGSGGVNGCPKTTPPQDGASCTVSTPDSCYYPGEACSCLQDLQGPGKHWGCYGTPDKCPTGAATHPTDGASCKGYSGGLCPYSASDFCACIPAFGGGGEPKWGCNQSDTCPATRPQNAFCSAVKECTYGDRACFCSGAVWGCE